MPTWAPMLAWWQWAMLAAVPPAIVALYFLKLKRQPLEVPSTYLWHKSIEDLHVNSIWQRLRQSLLLFLQLLLVGLAIFALLRPSWTGSKLGGDRFIFVIDASASMAATDETPTRLDEAKRRALEDIDKLDSSAAGMVISFSDNARVEQQFTSSHKLLRRAVEGIRQSNRITNIKEALQAAAGLANPGRSASDVRDTQVAEPLKAMLRIYTDGGMDRVEGFSLGNLKTKEGEETVGEFIQIGQAVYENPEETDSQKRGQITGWADNVGLVAFSARRKEGRLTQLEAFARLENFGPQEATVELELRLEGELVDARKVDIPPGESSGVPFDLGDVSSGVLEVRANSSDAFPLDDRAWTTIDPPRRVKLLLVTPGNEPLEFALGTERSTMLADMTREAPAFLETPKYQQQAAAAAWGLIIYDRCRPKEMPQASTLFIGAVPPLEGWKAETKANVPLFIGTDASHPIMQLIEMGDVMIVEGQPLVFPKGGSALIDYDVGPLLAIAPREGFEDVVLGFEIMSENQVATNWSIRPSFPVFVLNLLQYLGGNRDALSVGNVKPGQIVSLQSDAPASELDVVTPEGRKVRVSRGNLASFVFADTEQVGVYEVQRQSKTLSKFAVNLFHAAESDIKPKDMQIGHTEVLGKTATQPARRETWKLLLLFGLAVLLFEWYIYNRRVYL